MEFSFPKRPYEFDIEKHTIIVGLAGSKSYGTNHPKSDTDWKGTLIPPKKYYMTSMFKFDQTMWKSESKSGRVSEQEGIPEAEEEGTIYGIDKFIKLCSDCNPNVIELLFLNPKHYAVLTDEGRFLIENRDLFLSQRALYTFTGYAMSQLKRIKTHKGWIDNPPDHRPTREEFGLPEKKVIPGDQIKAAEKLIDRHLGEFAPWLLEVRDDKKEALYEGIYSILSLVALEEGISLDKKDSWIDIEATAKKSVAKVLGYDENFMEYLKREKIYGQARHQYNQYHSWIKNRNPARAELEARYGYDAKHAMHLVRLLRMGEEILTTGSVNVYRPDREELLRIRNGAWAYDYLIEWSEEKVQNLYDFVKEGKSVVPKATNPNKIAELSMEVKSMFLKRVGE